MNNHVDRAQLLLLHSRPKEAEALLRSALVGEPTDARALALLAESLIDQDRAKEATDAARQAIMHEPDSAHSHGALARCFLVRNRTDEARAAAREAVRLEPENPAWCALTGAVELAAHRWTDALNSADRGLRIDAEDSPCLNIRVAALQRLGRTDEAMRESEASVANDPTDAFAHANRGWSLLRTRRHKQAIDHFREALRMDPELEYARDGMLKAIKAQSRLYRSLLAYSFWISQLSPGARWGFVIGLYFLFRIVSAIGKSFPAAAPVTYPLLGLYVLFLTTTWCGDPLANLCLRFHRFGRWALSRDEIRGANIVGACLFALLGFVLAAVFLQSTGWPAIGALICFLLLFSGSSIHECSPGWPRKTMWAVFVVVLAAGAGAIIIDLTIGPRPKDTPMGQWDYVRAVLLIVALVVGAASSWFGASLVAAEPKE